MVLKIFDPARDRVVKDLTEEQSSFIKRCFGHSVSRRATELEYEYSNWFFSIIKAKKYQILCDCVPEATLPPKLTPADPCTLKRMPTPSNPAHSESCCFYVDRPNYFYEPSRDFADDSLSVHGEFHSRSSNASRIAPSGARKGEERSTELATVLFRLIENAGANCVGATSNTIPGPKEIWARSEKLTLCKDSDGEIKIKEYLVTSIDKDNDKRNLNKLKARILAANKWPRRSRPQGFFCGIAKGFEYKEASQEYEVKFEDLEDPIRVKSKPKVFAEDVANVRPPYLAIVSFSRVDKSDEEISAIQCYMQPCYNSECWLPVDSKYERRTLELLLEYKEKMLGDISISIVKPLRNIKSTRTGEYCRPDFVVTVFRGGKYVKRMAIETMGLNDPTYTQSKAITHPTMRIIYRTLVKHVMWARDRIVAEVNDSGFIDKVRSAVERGTSEVD